MPSTRPYILLLLTCLIGFMESYGQQAPFEKPRLTVASGLPQSYISGLAQDKAGFIWMGTFDGLARYDGYDFKIYGHRPNDPSGLAAGVIIAIFLDNNGKLWIQYQGGEVDILDTRTDHLFHFTADTVYRAALGHVNNISSTVQDTRNRYWMLTDKEELMRVDLVGHRMDIFSAGSLGLAGNRMTGIAMSNDGIMIVTDTAIVTISEEGKVRSSIPFTFQNPHLADSKRSWKDNAPVIRANGQVVIIDEMRAIIYDPAKHVFLLRPLPARKLYQYPHRIMDSSGNLLFSYGRMVFLLDKHNVLSVWQDSTRFPEEKPLSLLADRSGVYWVGTNGFGLRQYDARVPRLAYHTYHINFPEDILYADTNKPVGKALRMQHAIRFSNPYFFRWVKSRDPDNRIWVSIAGADRATVPDVYPYRNGHMGTVQWRYTDTAVSRRTCISALAVSRSGKLWALDHTVRLIRLDTASYTATVVAQVPVGKVTKSHNVNSLLVDGEDTCWVTTSLGMIRYIISSAETKKIEGILPAGAFTILAQDINDRNILWIGSLSGGLIRFNKSDLTHKVYTTDDGLPNNTVYAIMQYGQELWCSSNKGIFAFDTQTGDVKTFNVTDGLAENEFNRFHFFHYPDGRFAFGGTNGYTVFDPASLGSNAYHPTIAITGLKIHNHKADFGSPGSPLPASLNSLDTLTLSYHQNFLELGFAALEYNIPEKLQYRYKMEGIDKQWVLAGNNHSAVYTDLSPGKYVFIVNGTNSAGKWSTSVKKLYIIIRPPFWYTWWFTGLCIMLAGTLFYMVIRARFAGIRKQEQQKHHFEKEVIQLEALALRAQMNPHFIFNCLNSIKALIQENKNEKAVAYLTTFSKLIRNQLNNAQQEISLHDEILTCKLYLKLESLRFGDRISFGFIADPKLNTHAVKVPPLFLQPVIENAIWHGILPLEKNGQVFIRIERKDNILYCTIDDNGVGRKTSAGNHSKGKAMYTSRGMQLVEERLRLHNLGSDIRDTVEVIDKKDALNNALGTCVILKLTIKDD